MVGQSAMNKMLTSNYTNAKWGRNEFGNIASVRFQSVQKALIYKNYALVQFILTTVEINH